MARTKQPVTNQPEQTGVAPSLPVIMTVDQVAGLLQIPKSSVYERTRFRGNGDSTPPLPHRRVGRYLRFFRDEIIKWMLALPQASHPRKRKYACKQRKAAA